MIYLVTCGEMRDSDSREKWVASSIDSSDYKGLAWVHSAKSMDSPCPSPPLPLVILRTSTVEASPVGEHSVGIATFAAPLVIECCTGMLSTFCCICSGSDPASGRGP